MKEANLLCLQAGNANPLAGIQDMTDNYARSFFTQCFCVGLNVREGLLGDASTEVLILAKDISKHIVDGFEVLALGTELTSHSRPCIKVDVGSIALASRDLACLVAYFA